MYRVTSASGTTASVNEDIMATMLTFTSTTSENFRPKALYLECGAETTIKVNGENETFLKLDAASGKYVIDLGKYDVIVKTLVITDTAIVWRATFLY